MEIVMNTDDRVQRILDARFYYKVQARIPVGAGVFYSCVSFRILTTVSCLTA